MRPGPQVSSRALTLSLMGASLLTLTLLVLYSLFYGSGHDNPLPVQVTLDQRPVEALGGRGAVLTEVVVVENTADFDLPLLTLDLNGQYFLYQASPLKSGETLVLPQGIFKTKSNQTFVPGRYPITRVNVTAQLPSGARGVAEVDFPEK